MRRLPVSSVSFVILVYACGSGGTSSAPPAPDFTLSDSGSVSVTPGATTSPISVSVTAVNGFTGNVSVKVSGLPTGATTNPAFPLSVAPGKPQQFTVSVPPSIGAGDSTLSLTGTNGALIHSAPPVTLTIEAVQTFESSGVYYLQAYSGGHTARIGLDAAKGGSIVEVSLDGTNFVNAHDTGREVQPAMYDGAATYSSFNCSPCIGTWGWNPVLGGDNYNRGSPILSAQLGSGTLNVKSQPLQWNPDDKGGGPANPVAADATIEQAVSVVPGTPLAFKVHLTITHTGTDQHYNAEQEIPAVYVNSQYGNLKYYGGTRPWTSDAITTVTSVPVLPANTGDLYSPEQWAAYTDDNGQGLTVFVPGVYPYVNGFSAPGGGGSGPTGDATYYFHQSAPFTFGPGAVFEGDFYLIPGDQHAARALIYSLHRTLAVADSFSPLFASLDAPSANSTISGATVQFAGWAIDNTAVSDVELVVDDVGIAAAAPTVDRPDVVAAYPNLAPLQCGFASTFDSTKLANGKHLMSLRVTDTSGNVALFPPASVTVSN
jgi:hypothetical protein